jgi:ribosomal protein S18 acetylase RimI-like enzyme
MDYSRVGLFLVGDYTAWLMNSNDAGAVQEFFEQCNDYFELVDGEKVGPNAGIEIFEQKPDKKSIDDKYVIGIFGKCGSLVGIIDMVVDYPVDGEWFIGLLMLSPNYRNLGLGEKIYREFESWALRSGARSIGLGVVEQNKKAYHFWEQLGFELIEKRPPKQFGNKENVVLVMRRALVGSSQNAVK